MRKLIAIAVIIFIYNFSASAQIRKGAVFIGGDISFVKYENENPANNSSDNHFSISPVIGFAVRENLVAGFLLTYYTGKSKEIPAGYTSKWRAMGGGVFMRKYYRIKTSDFSVFLHGELNAVFGKSEWKNPTLSNESTSIEIPLNLYPGISFRLRKAVHLEAGLNSFFSVSYRHAETKQGADTFTNNTLRAALNVFNFDEHLYFGVRILLDN